MVDVDLSTAAFLSEHHSRPGHDEGLRLDGLPPRIPSHSSSATGASSPEQELKHHVKRLEEELLALRECLAQAGLIRPEAFQAQLHRRRFEAARQEFPLGSQDVSISNAMPVGVGHRIAKFAGWSSTSALNATSKPMNSQLCKVAGSLRNDLSLLYVCGGWDDGQQALGLVESFDPNTRTWETMPSLGQPRACALAAQAMGNIYICGGWDGERALNTVERFNPRAGSWEACAPMAQLRFSASGDSLNQHICVCGGWDGAMALDTAERFDVRAGVWEALPRMLQRRAHATAVATNGHLYVCAGWDGNVALDHAERLDARSGQWEAMPPLSQRLSRPCAAAVDGCVYVCGGWAGQQAVSNVEMFDTRTPDAIWKVLTSMPRGRAGAVAAGVAGSLYICGGWDGQECVGSVDCYGAPDDEDPQDAQRADRIWKVMPPLPTRRRGAAAVVGYKD